MENENLKSFKFVYKKVEDINAIMEKLTIDFSNVNKIEDESDGSSGSLGSSSGIRKSLRSRNTNNYAEDNLHKIKQKTISRPKKVVSVDSSEKDLKNFYLSVNKKMPNVKPTLLETIFEDEESNSVEANESSDGPNDSLNTFLTKRCKKYRRSLTLCDGLNANKALQTKRKNRVKKLLGKRPKKFKKISLSNFMDYLKTRESNETDNNLGPPPTTLNEAEEEMDV